MSDERIDIWRAAIKDSAHPRHKAAWILFTESKRPEGIGRLLEAQKDDIIPWLYEILEIDELHESGSFGDGWAPINAVHLLGQWQVVEAVPRLLKIVETDEDEAIITGSAASALGNMPLSAIIDPLLELAGRAETEICLTIAGILGDAAKGDARAYAWLKSFFLQQRKEWDIEYMAENLLVADAQQAIPFLEDWLKKARVSQDTRKRLQKYIEDARTGRFP